VGVNCADAQQVNPRPSSTGAPALAHHARQDLSAGSKEGCGLQRGLPEPTALWMESEEAPPLSRTVSSLLFDEQASVLGLTRDHPPGVVWCVVLVVRVETRGSEPLSLSARALASSLHTSVFVCVACFSFYLFHVHLILESSAAAWSDDISPVRARWRARSRSNRLIFRLRHEPGSAHMRTASYVVVVLLAG